MPIWAWEIIGFAEFAQEGHWPLAGGLLDQTASFLDACRFIWREISIHKAKTAAP